MLYLIAILQIGHCVGEIALIGIWNSPYFALSAYASHPEQVKTSKHILHPIS
jgi:hypothetical protein